MDNLDITPAFIDVFNRINKHLDLLPFQKLLSDQNSTLSDEEKQSLKSKINESAKKMRQLNLVLDELKDQLVNEIERVQFDFEEKNRDLDELEKHLNYVRTNQSNRSKTTTAVQKHVEIQNNLDDFSDVSDETDQVKKENMNRFINQPPDTIYSQNLPKKSIRKPTSHLKVPSQLKMNDNVVKSSLIKPMYSNENQQSYNHMNKPTKNVTQQQQLQPKKEKVKNVDNIYINYPQIGYISLNEFNYIPKYMRGRMSFETCNRLVDEFNKTIEHKYKFMMIPTIKYTKEELTKYTIYKSQEDDETRGLFFVTPKDLHDYSDLKISMNNTKIFIQCVRHCKRVKEIRGIDKLIRYIILNW